MHTSIEETIKKEMWLLNKQSRLPLLSLAAATAQNMSISGRKMISYSNDMDVPIISPMSYDQSHTMEKAIITSSKLGLMLRNLNNDFFSRYTDELLLTDKHVKSIGDVSISNRAKSGPVLGSRNKNLVKYSMIGHVGLLLSVMF
jgi:hypothetical protein